MTAFFYCTIRLSTKQSFTLDTPSRVSYIRKTFRIFSSSIHRFNEEYSNFFPRFFLFRFSFSFRRNKSGGDAYGSDAGNNGSGGGIGKWLREHLGGGSKGSHDINSVLPSKSNVNQGNVSNEEKYFGRATISTSQNLYCSLPREHGRHGHNSIRKSPHGNSSKSQGQDRPRSSGSNYHEKFVAGDPGGLTRGGPIYGSEGKSLKKRNRDRRRHSLNEPHVHDRQRRRR